MKSQQKRRCDNNIFSKDLAYLFSTLLVVAGCYLFYEIRDNGANIVLNFKIC